MLRTKKDARYFLVAESAVMKSVVSALEGFSAGDAPVLICGEHGTGRELAARVLHDGSPRRARKFFAVRPTFATEGDGSHDTQERAADNAFASAAGGTLLIKDISDLSAAAQRSVKRVLRRAATDARGEARLVATADTDLEVAVNGKMLGRDLYEALSRQRLELPPLRARVEDIPQLVERWLAHYAEEIGRGSMKVTARAHERLMAYPWPGNVAELKNIVRRLAARVSGTRVEGGNIEEVLPVLAERVPLEDLSFEDMVKAKLAGFMRRMDGYPVTDLYEKILERVERPLFDLVLEQTAGNQVKAAEILGVNRNTLRRRLAVFGMRTKRAGKRPRVEAALDVTRAAGANRNE